MDRARRKTQRDAARRATRGLPSLTERIITRENFLRSLGIMDEPPQRSDARAASLTAQPVARAAANLAGTAWLVAGAGGLDADSFSQNFSMPRSFQEAGSSIWEIGERRISFQGLERSLSRRDCSEIAVDDEDILIVPFLTAESTARRRRSRMRASAEDGRDGFHSPVSRHAHACRFRQDSTHHGTSLRSGDFTPVARPFPNPCPLMEKEPSPAVRPRLFVACPWPSMGLSSLTLRSHR